MKHEPVFPSPFEKLFSKYEEQAAQKIQDVASGRKPAGHDRRWSRCNVPEARRCCELKIGDEVFPAQLLNKSADGFGVLVTGPNCPSVGQVVQLYTDAEWLPIRVVYAAQVAQPTDAEFGEHNHGPCFRLGCSRRLKRSLLSRLRGR